jgi:adenylate kinase family enzyme
LLSLLQQSGFDDVTGEPLIRRADDEPETIRVRLEKYNEMTAPLLDYYKSKGVLFGFKGTESDVIFKELEQFLKTKLPRIEV